MHLFIRRFVLLVAAVTTLAAPVPTPGGGGSSSKDTGLVYRTIDNKVADGNALWGKHVNKVHVWMKDVHWRSTLEITGPWAETTGGPTTKGLRLNMMKPQLHEKGTAPTHTNTEGWGSLVVDAARAKLFSGRAIFEEALPITGTVTVRQILDAIQTAQLHLYKFDLSTKSGCLYWNLSFVYLLEHNNWVAAGTTASLMKNIHGTHNNEIVWPPKQGSFTQLTATEKHYIPKTLYTSMLSAAA